MTCQHPRTIWLRRYYPIHCTDDEITRLNKPVMEYRKGYYPIEVPCGQCLGCKLDHANEWATRCWCEMNYWSTGCFITLTYNNNHLPHNPKTGIPELRLEHVQQFMKNLRRNETGLKYWTNPINHKYEAPIRYMGCGEYGEKKKRPHYHLCIFNWQPDDLKYYKTTKRGDILYTSQKLQKYWEDKQGDKKFRGIIIVGMLTYKSACYTARYCQKKAGIEPKHRQYVWDKKEQKYKIKKNKEKKTPEFICCSRMPGIGRIYWECHKEKIKENNGIWINDGKAKLKNLPRYFRKIWEQENWEEYVSWKYEQQKQGEENQKQQLKQFNCELNDYQKTIILRNLQEKILKEKAQFLIRDNIEEGNDIICDSEKKNKVIDFGIAKDEDLFYMIKHDYKPVNDNWENEEANKYKYFWKFNKLA